MHPRVRMNKPTVCLCICLVVCLPVCLLSLCCMSVYHKLFANILSHCQLVVCLSGLCLSVYYNEFLFRCTMSSL